jgi:S-DNA-T family DNA segregation ATPase FtsK/SpoIIIE
LHPGPRKEVLPTRDRFGYRVGLRQDYPDEVRMTLSDTAYERGARCDTIPEDCPGMGYVIDEDGGKRQPVKVRADWVSDAELIWLSSQHSAPAQVEVPPLAAKNRTPARVIREDKGRAA